ncbi:MAG: lipoate--protein ligase family protein [Planctomycetota bacterium]|jgi:lipoate-protein ligase A
MNREKWYLYDAGPDHPFQNMAMDEVLLTRWSGKPVLVRLYTWEPPGLSLGYFQKYEEIRANEAARQSGALITRRITGGSAILHIHELTFSIVGREGEPPFHDSVESSYHRIHLALARGFESLGIRSSLREQGRAVTHPAGAHRGRCFYAVTRYDLVADGRKLVGSAQRRTGGKVLHHGSIPLAPNPMTSKAADLGTLSGQSVPYEKAAEAVRHGLEDYFQVDTKDWEPDIPLKQECDRLAREKYGAPGFVRRR